MASRILPNHLSIIYLFIIWTTLTLGSCSGESPEDLEAEGLEFISVDNSDAVIAIRRDQSGKILEKGIVRNGVKDGIWMTYHDNDRVKSLTSYVNGKINGTHFEFNNRGQIELRAEYLNEAYHGIVANYKFGRLEKEMTYEKGVLNGPFVIYTDRGKLQRKGSFNNGKQHGTLQYFDDEENVIMQYEYENGEKISGGIVDHSSDSTKVQ